MATYHALIRVPGAIDGAVVGPFAQQLVQDPSDGEIVDHDGDPESGVLRVAYDADDTADAEMHAQLLAERAPGCSVEQVTAAP